MLESRSGNFVKGPYNQFYAIDLTRRTEVVENYEVFMTLDRIKRDLHDSAALIETSGPVLGWINRIIYRNDLVIETLEKHNDLYKDIEVGALILEKNESLYIEDDLFDTYAEGMLFAKVIFFTFNDGPFSWVFYPTPDMLLDGFISTLRAVGGEKGLSKLSTLHGRTPKTGHVSEDENYDMLAKNTLARLIAKGFVFRVDGRFDGKYRDRGEYEDLGEYLNPAYFPTDLALKRLTPDSLYVFDFDSLRLKNRKKERRLTKTAQTRAVFRVVKLFVSFFRSWFLGCRFFRSSSFFSWSFFGSWLFSRRFGSSFFGFKFYTSFFRSSSKCRFAARSSILLD